jgi:hypothetical protein
VFADAVVDDDLVVHRIADQRQQGDDGGQVHLPAHQGDEPEGLGDVQKQHRDGTGREMPFEPHPDVGQHRKHREAEGDQPRGRQLAADRGAHEVDLVEDRARHDLCGGRSTACHRGLPASPCTRINASFGSPKACRLASPGTPAAIAARNSASGMATSERSTICTPPVKSMPRFGPGITSAATAPSDSTADVASASRPRRMKDSAARRAHPADQRRDFQPGRSAAAHQRLHHHPHQHHGGEHGDQDAQRHGDGKAADRARAEQNSSTIASSVVMLASRIVAQARA